MKPAPAIIAAFASLALVRLTAAPIPISNAGFESPGGSGLIPASSWTGDAGTALHSAYPRGGSTSLGSRFAYTNPNALPASQTLGTTFAPNTTYTFKGYGVASSTPNTDLKFLLGYDNNGVFVQLAATTYDLNAITNWTLLDGVSHTTGSGSLEIGRNMVVRLQAVGASNQGAWFDAVTLDSVPFVDNTPPSLLLPTTPADGASGINPATQLVARFNEPILAGQGNVRVRNLAENSETIIPITDPRVVVAGSLLTISPGLPLPAETAHAVWIEAGAVTDAAGNPFPGILDDTGWNFTTAIALEPPPPPGSGARPTLNLAGAGWFAWQDSSAAWQADTLYLPQEVNLAVMPVNPPTGGWPGLFARQDTPCSLPAAVEELFGKGRNTYRYHGVTWFYRKVFIPQEWQNRRIFCHLEKTRLRMELYVNDQLAGYDLIAETPYQSDITSALVFGAENRIAIRLTNPGGGRGWPDYPGIAWGTYNLPASIDFAGIDTPVELVAVDPVRVDEVLVRNDLPAGARNATVLASISNTGTLPRNATLAMTIEPIAGGPALFTDVWQEFLPAGGAIDITRAVTVPGASLWDLENPHLYRCRIGVTTTVSHDETSVTFGFRTFEVRQSQTGSQDNFYLNGKRLRLRSAIDWGYYGATGFYATPEMALKSVQAARDIGHNAISFHRRIGEKRVLEYADSLGLYLFEEPGGFHAGGQGYTVSGPFASAIMEEKCRRMVKRDFNHPSLLIYNLCNEDNVWNPLRQTVMEMIAGIDSSRMVVNSSGGNGGGASGVINHIRPYESAIRSDFRDDHTVGAGSRYEASRVLAHNIQTDDAFLYGEVGCNAGPSNWFELEEAVTGLANGTQGYDRALYQSLHGKIRDLFDDCNLAAASGGAIASPADVTRQAGRGLMYINGRYSQFIMSHDSQDGYAINGWSSGPQDKGGSAFEDWDSAILDQGRNLRGVAADYAYWTRPLQISIVRNGQSHVSPGDSAGFKVFLINEGHLPAGAYDLRLKLKDGGGNDTGWTHQAAVTVLGGDTHAQTLIANLTAQALSSYKGGYLTLEAGLYSGNQLVADGAEQVMLANRVSFQSQLSGLQGAVHAWPEAKSALQAAGQSVPDYSDTLGRLDYIVLGDTTGGALESILRRVREDGTRLVVRFRQNEADALFAAGILSQPVTQWGGQQTGNWTGNGWGYLDSFLGDQALPGATAIGTNSWEVPGNPTGFHPFHSDYPQRAHGAYFARPDTLLVLSGSIRYGQGDIVLNAGYHVDANHALNDLMFFNMITTGLSADLRSEPTYEAWQVNTVWGGIPGSLRDENDDPDSDGLTNRLEWAFGSDPTYDDGQRYPMPMMDGNTINFFYPKPRAALLYGFEKSTDLTSWADLGHASESYHPSGDWYSRAISIDSVNEPRAFFRMNLSDRIAINAGGGTSSYWSADKSSSGGTGLTNGSLAIETGAVANPAPDAVYRSCRSGNFSYTLAGLTPGKVYDLRLHFCEISHTQAGSRIFNVSVQGGSALASFDPIAAAGGPGIAITRQFSATADGSGMIVIGFNTLVGNAMVNGIEILAH